MSINIDPKSTAATLSALSSPARLQIMMWLLDPRAHFPEQKDGDLVEDGVCVGFITEKIGLTQPTVSSHMKKLADAGLVTGKKFGNWMFYKPSRSYLAALGDDLAASARMSPSPAPKI
ncbi:MAG: metalloregulator ArsR/SmtB family transcription factor [Roseibium sp.]